MRPRSPSVWMIREREKKQLSVAIIGRWRDGHLVVVNAWQGPTRVRDIEKLNWFVRWCGRIDVPVPGSTWWLEDSDGEAPYLF